MPCESLSGIRWYYNFNHDLCDAGAVHRRGQGLNPCSGLNFSAALKVIPWFCIAQPFLRITWAPFCVSSQPPPRLFSILRVISESMTTFHGSLWGNKLGKPQFFFQVFAKNSLINNIFEEEKKFDSRTCFFGENSYVLGVFWPRRGLRANHGTVQKSAIFSPPDNQKQLKWSNTAYVSKKKVLLSR